MRVLTSKAVALLGAATLILAACGSNAAPTNPGPPTAVGAEAPAQAGASSAVVSSKPAALSGTGPVTAISAGSSQTCALLSDGSVMCWGSNGDGEFGNGSTSTEPTSTPARVGGLSAVTAIAASSSYTCAVTGSGGAKCWGSNLLGLLGNGSAVRSLTPVDVTGLTSGVVAISAGDRHACAVTSAGGAKCWGGNGSGELGTGSLSTISSTVPLAVSGLTSGVTGIAVGVQHTCAITSAGGVKCWGAGWLGNGTQASSLIPVDVVGLTSGVAAIVAGPGYAGTGYTCVRMSAGGVKCWGGLSSVPVDVTGLTSGVSAIAMGQGRVCAIASAGGVKCWDSFHPTPVDLADLTSPVTAISLGGSNTCVLTSGGSVKCLSGSTATPGFVDIVGLTPGQNAVQAPSASAPPASGNATAISAGSAHTCVTTKAGGVKCWGNNAYGQLGSGTTPSLSAAPVDVFGLASGIAAIGLGKEHSCGITTSGGVKCWGKNDLGQLGNGTTTNSLIPVDVSGLATGITAIALGDYTTCALTNKGAVKCWGPGTLGNASAADPARPRTTPIDVSALQGGVTAITAGGAQVCVLTSAGGVKCWSSRTPVDVPGLTSGVTAIAAGQGYACAVTGGGGVKCWGDNSSGQLGVTPRPSFISSATPVEIPGLTSGVSAIAAGWYHVCALTSGGGIKCWGNGANLGDGTLGTSSTGAPVDVIGLTSGVTAITAGRGHTCALTSAGVVKCWGSSNALGNATGKDATTPVDVAGL